MSAHTAYAEGFDVGISGVTNITPSEAVYRQPYTRDEWFKGFDDAVEIRASAWDELYHPGPDQYRGPCKGCRYRTVCARLAIDCDPFQFWVVKGRIVRTRGRGTRPSPRAAMRVGMIEVAA